MYNIANFKQSSGGIMSSIDKDREKRLKRTGRWFDDSFTRNNRDLYLTYLMPALLIVSLCATLYVALSN